MLKEREFLYQAVIDYKPSLVFEVGTWKGGGSTWQIMRGLEENKNGNLITCETDREFYQESIELYKNNAKIQIHFAPSDKMISFLLKDLNYPDFLFFDGPEDEDTAYIDFLSLNPVLKKGALFCMHDWDDPSIKARKIRPYIEKSEQWELISKLTSPDSVGICLYKKIL